MRLMVTSSVQAMLGNSRSERREQACLGLTNLRNPSGFGRLEGKTLTLEVSDGSCELLSDRIVLLGARVFEDTGSFTMHGFAVTDKDPQNPRGVQRIKITGRLRRTRKAHAFTGRIHVQTPA